LFSSQKLKDEDKGSGDLSIPDESSGESGSGNESTAELPGSYSPSPLSSPTVISTVDKLAKGLVGVGSVLVNPLLLAQAVQPGHKVTPLHIHHPVTSASGIPTSVTGGGGAYTRIGTHRTSLIQQTNTSNLSTFSSEWTEAVHVKLGINNTRANCDIFLFYLQNQNLKLV
jgi:hypothetical protein